MFAFVVLKCYNKLYKDHMKRLDGWGLYITQKRRNSHEKNDGTRTESIRLHIVLY